MLPWRHQKFVHEFLRTGCATTAARHCGLGGPDGTHAGARGYEILQLPAVIAEIDAERARLAAAARLERGALLAELKAIATASIADFVVEDPASGARSISLDEASLQTLSAVASVTLTPMTFGHQIKVKLHSKIAAIDQICKILGWHGPTRHELTGASGAPLIFERYVIDPMAPPEPPAIEHRPDA